MFDVKDCNNVAEIEFRDEEEHLHNPFHEIHIHNINSIKIFVTLSTGITGNNSYCEVPLSKSFRARSRPNFLHF